MKFSTCLEIKNWRLTVPRWPQFTPHIHKPYDRFFNTGFFTTFSPDNYFLIKGSEIWVWTGTYFKEL